MQIIKFTIPSKYKDDLLKFKDKEEVKKPIQIIFWFIKSIEDNLSTVSRVQSISLLKNVLIKICDELPEMNRNITENNLRFIDTINSLITYLDEILKIQTAATEFAGKPEHAPAFQEAFWSQKRSQDKIQTYSSPKVDYTSIHSCRTISESKIDEVIDPKITEKDPTSEKLNQFDLPNFGR